MEIPVAAGEFTKPSYSESKFFRILCFTYRHGLKQLICFAEQQPDGARQADIYRNLEPTFQPVSVHKPDDDCGGLAVGEENAAAGDDDDVGETDSAVEVAGGGRGRSLGVLSTEEGWSPPLDDGDEAAAAAMAAAISDWESIPAAGGAQEAAAAAFMAEGKKYWRGKG